MTILSLAAFLAFPSLGLPQAHTGVLSEAFASPGVAGSATAARVHDDGRGPALYVAGNFEAAGSTVARHVARWDGHRWEPLGAGPNLYINALEVYDDGSGSGPALYAAGSGSHVLHRWDGANWSAIASKAQPYKDVNVLRVFDDGAGPKLIAGGNFTKVAGVKAKGVIRYDGAGWSPMGLGLDGWVGALADYDDGTGSALFAAGRFKFSGTGYRELARWDGTSWGPLGVFEGDVYALTVFDGELIATGSFTSVDNVAAGGLARWNGTRWAPVGSGVGAIANYGFAGSVRVAGVHPVVSDGRPELVVGGSFLTVDGLPATSIATWNGTRWRSLAEGVRSGGVAVLESLEHELFVAGSLGGTGGGAHGITRWDGERWSALTRGLGIWGPVFDLQMFDDGSGAALFACGNLGNAGGTGVGAITRWDGSRWSPVGREIAFGGAESLAVFDDGSGPALYLGGDFTWIGNQWMSGTAKWDGTRWSPLGTGVCGWVSTQVVFDGSLYVAGDFNSAGSVVVGNIARWDGDRWWDVDGGVESTVRSLAVFDDGFGPALYASGNFWFAGLGSQTVAAYGFARWDGSAWSAVSGSASLTNRMLVQDLGTGERLFSVGSKKLPSGENVAVWQWDGIAWEGVGDGAAGILTMGYCLGVQEGANGPVLYASGSSAVDPTQFALARWDGASWTEVLRTNAALCDLATAGDGSTFLGGFFTLMDGTPSSHVARLVNR
jgi:hypothetical protein